MEEPFVNQAMLSWPLPQTCPTCNQVLPSYEEPQPLSVDDCSQALSTYNAWPNSPVDSIAASSESLLESPTHRPELSYLFDNPLCLLPTSPLAYMASEHSGFGNNWSSGEQQTLSILPALASPPSSTFSPNLPSYGSNTFGQQALPALPSVASSPLSSQLPSDGLNSCGQQALTAWSALSSVASSPSPPQLLSDGLSSWGQQVLPASPASPGLPQLASSPSPASLSSYALNDPPLPSMPPQTPRLPPMRLSPTFPVANVASDQHPTTYSRGGDGWSNGELQALPALPALPSPPSSPFPSQTPSAVLNDPTLPSTSLQTPRLPPISLLLGPPSPPSPPPSPPRRTTKKAVLSTCRARRASEIVKQATRRVMKTTRGREAYVEFRELGLKDCELRTVWWYFCNVRCEDMRACESDIVGKNLSEGCLLNRLRRLRKKHPRLNDMLPRRRDMVQG